MRPKTSTLILACRRECEASGNWYRYKANLSVILLQNLLCPICEFELCQLCFHAQWTCRIGWRCGCWMHLSQKKSNNQSAITNEADRHEEKKKDLKQNIRSRQKICERQSMAGHFQIQPLRDYNESKALRWNQYNGFVSFFLFSSSYYYCAA